MKDSVLLDPSDYAEWLRTVGQWLDAQGAHDLEIVVDAYLVTVICQVNRDTPHRHSFSRVELGRLSEAAQLRRNHSLSQPSGHWAAMLRTVGQELATEQITLTRLCSEEIGLRAYGAHGQRYFNHVYPWDELRMLNRSRYNERAMDGLRQRATHAIETETWWSRMRGRLCTSVSRLVTSPARAARRQSSRAQLSSALRDRMNTTFTKPRP